VRSNFVPQHAAGGAAPEIMRSLCLNGTRGRLQCSANGAEGLARLLKSKGLLRTVKKNKTPRTAGDSPAARLLANYRRRLLDLLGRAEVAAPREPAELRLAVATLVEALNDDLLRLYRLAESGTLTRSDQMIVMPALERLRDTLRHRGSRLHAMSDTLHKAIAGLPASG
jgi:hypothetical protein